MCRRFLEIVEAGECCIIDSWFELANFELCHSYAVIPVCVVRSNKGPLKVVACQIRSPSLQSTRLSTSTNIDLPSDQERTPRWKNHPAEEWVCIAMVTNASSSSLAHALLAVSAHTCVSPCPTHLWLGPHCCSFPKLGQLTRSNRPLGLIVVTLTPWSLSRNWVLILKDLRRLPPSFKCTLWNLLLNLSIPDVPFPVLLSTLIRSRFQAKRATLLILIDFPSHGKRADCPSPTKGTMRCQPNCLH